MKEELKRDAHLGQLGCRSTCNLLHPEVEKLGLLLRELFCQVILRPVTNIEIQQHSEKSVARPSKIREPIVCALGLEFVGLDFSGHDDEGLEKRYENAGRRRRR